MPLHLAELHVVSHTHWDLEWYHTAAHFAQRLARLIDELLDDPPSAGASFLLDGQAILLDDYVAVRPERMAEVVALLRNGALEAGPWYVLADELMPGGEALVRNLMIGRQTVRRLGVEAPNVLYCPDAFGHPAALPDIAKGFGCDMVMLWRGYGGARWPEGDTVTWRGTGGSTVLLYHLPPDGYEFGSSLPCTRTHAIARWANVAGVLVPRAITGTAVLLNGADHHARQQHIGVAIDLLTHAAAPTRVRPSSLRDAARALCEAARTVDLPEIRGELRDSYGYTWTLQGTFGTRAAQKRRNAAAERLLTRDVEPWIALASHGGSPGSRALLNAAWRSLLRAHPHDTLCGTSIDAVAEAFDARLADVEEQGGGLQSHALHTLVAHDAEAARAAAATWTPAVLLRNPVARARGGVVELTLRSKIADVAVGPGSASKQGVRRRAPAYRVEGMPLQILSRRECIELTEAPRAYPDADVVREASALGWIDHIGGYVVETRAQRGRARALIPNPVMATAHSLDNGRVRIEVSDAGEVSMEDRAMGRRISDLIALERNRDRGDLYTPAIREALEPPRLHRVRLVHRGPLRGEIAIDFVYGGRAAERSRCRITVRLDADSSLLHMSVCGNNRHRDQRLRLVVQTRIASARTVADAAFWAVERAPLAISAADAAMEHVVPTAPLHRWVALFAHEAGATLISDGLAEYQSANDGSLAVTLVRSVGELSRADLPERPGHAGWPSPTPAAQCLGPYKARFALRLHGPDSDAVRAEIERCAEDALLPIVGETLRSNMLPPRMAGGLELAGNGLAFSTASPAQRNGWTVLRCVNQRDTPTLGSWRIGRPIVQATRARLDETPLSELSIGDGVIRFDAAPHEIVTILVR